MKHWLMIGLIAAAPPAHAQLTPPENDILTAVAKCMVEGLPQDWYEARLVVTLDEPGATTGSGRYEYALQLAREDWLPFTPCAYTNPARLLVGMRRYQAEDRKGWKATRFVLHRDGKFDLTYDYPKPPAAGN